MNTGPCNCGLPMRSLLARLAVLTGLMLAAYGSVLLVAAGSPARVAAASLTAGVCLASAAAALVMSAWLRTIANGPALMLLPMMIRAGLPLFLAVIVRMRGRGLVEANFVYYLIGFYLLALLIELPMSLPRTADARHATADSEGSKPNG